MVSQARLKERLNYNPLTGVFYWRPLQTITKGARVDRFEKIAGGINPVTGHRIIQIGRKHYRAHQLAWLYMTDAWPSFQIDHRDGVRDNNVWSNLRAATRSQNLANSKRRSDNTTGFKGVTKRSGGLFRARLMVSGRSLSLGDFKTAQEAHQAYCAASQQHFGEYARAA